MDLDFRPGIGALPLLFGTNRSVIRGGPLKTAYFEQAPMEPENDFYTKEGLILGYDGNDTLEFVEVIPPSSCVFEGVSLLGTSLASVLSALAALGHHTRLEGDSCDFRAIGVMLFCPSGVVESASLYREGYYDRM